MYEGAVRSCIDMTHKMKYEIWFIVKYIGAMETLDKEVGGSVDPVDE